MVSDKFSDSIMGCNFCADGVDLKNVLEESLEYGKSKDCKCKKYY